ncbi:unnamed protein product [Allacma fusca]|uniref:O-acyltransferase WSD1-like N-terminal domain-containing protein n=1 Tax=Allacma fusca TaxID=39272 RepID=A0A8J2LNY1_9HEXA|nr:unnamed protein product [Allacma fusca]
MVPAYPNRLFATFLMMVLFLLLILSVPVWILFMAVRAGVWLISRVLRPDLEKFVSGSDSIFAMYDGTRAVTNITTCFITNGHVSCERVQEMFTERVLRAEWKCGDLYFKRLKQSWTTFLGYPFWRTDVDFDVKNHIRYYDYGGEISLSKECSEEDLTRAFVGLSQVPWKKDQSPWEFLVIPGYKSLGYSGPRTAILLRLDHVLCDAYSIILFLRTLFHSPMKCTTGNLNERSLSLAKRSGLVFKVVYDLADLCLNELDSSQLRSPVISCVKGVDCSISEAVPVDLIKEIKNYYKVSYAAVIYSVIHGAIQATLEKHKELVPKNLATFIILPKPDRPDKFVNHLYGTCSKLSCNSNCPQARLQEIYQKLMKAHSSSTPFGIDLLGSQIQYSPVFLRRFFSHKLHLVPFGVSVGCTIFPALTGTDFFDGCEVTDLFFGLGPSLNIGIFVAVWGTNKQQKFVFIVDKTMFRSDKIIQSFGWNVQHQVQLLAKGLNQTGQEPGISEDHVEVTVL